MLQRRNIIPPFLLPCSAMMKFRIILFVILCNSFLSLIAQPSIDSTFHKFVPSFKEYQFSLPERALDIEWIEYDKDKVRLHGKLSPDGKSIILRNYQNGQMVRVKVLLPNGKKEEYVKSPCFIDPVIDAL